MPCSQNYLAIVSHWTVMPSHRWDIVRLMVPSKSGSKPLMEVLHRLLPKANLQDWLFVQAISIDILNKSEMKLPNDVNHNLLLFGYLCSLQCLRCNLHSFDGLCDLCKHYWSEENNDVPAPRLIHSDDNCHFHSVEGYNFAPPFTYSALPELQWTTY